jgi:Na+-translocating ferredoxin:NAD+ oxidoreductase RNF subunit RnfB
MFKESFEEEEKIGKAKHRGRAWEIGTAMAGLMSGVHLLVMLDQYAIDVVERFLDRIYQKRIETAEELYKFLPMDNCQNCNYESCFKLAEAVMKGEEKLEMCERLTEAGIRTIKQLLNPPKEVAAPPEAIYDWIKQM